MQEDALAAAGRDELRARAVEILSRPEYARSRALEAEWVDGVRRAVQDLFARIAGLFDWLDSLRLAQPVVYWMLLLALLVLGGLLLTHVVWSIRVALRPPAGTARAPEAPPGAALVLADEAAAFACRGAYLEAAHRMELATIEVLLQRGAIRLARHEANRTLRGRIAGASVPAGERVRFALLLDRFETAWFRDRNADRDLYEGWRELHARIAAGGS